MVLGQTAKVMGILNVTPDSFSDGGQFDAVPRAVAQARLMLAEGADIIDIGGESTRPGAEEVSAAEELARVVPVIEALCSEGFAAPISIDTYKAEVAARALDAGAGILNDVHGLQREPEIAAVAAERGAPVVVMHWDKARDTSRDLIREVARYFDDSLAIADKAGLPRGQIVLDPGFGFGKSLDRELRTAAAIARTGVAGLPGPRGHLAQIDARPAPGRAARATRGRHRRHLGARLHGGRAHLPGA